MNSTRGQGPLIITVDGPQGARITYHPSCYIRAVEASKERRGAGHPTHMISEYSCGHCYLCGGLLWQPLGACIVHDGPCPTTDWLTTSTFYVFSAEWTLSHGWTLDQDVIDTATLILNEPSAPDNVDDLINRTRYILDRTT